MTINDINKQINQGGNKMSNEEKNDTTNDESNKVYQAPFENIEEFDAFFNNEDAVLKI